MSMDRARLEGLLKLVMERMLHLENKTIAETCPIGIIDFEKWEWPQEVGLYGPPYRERGVGERRNINFCCTRNISRTR